MDSFMSNNRFATRNITCSAATATKEETFTYQAEVSSSCGWGTVVEPSRLQYFVRLLIDQSTSSSPLASSTATPHAVIIPCSPCSRADLLSTHKAMAESGCVPLLLLQVDRLMDMIVNSLYSNREVFLRELISNASDALDKVRFVGVTEPKALEGREKLEILIKADKDAKTITIE
jgi:hypothetical protein